MKKFTKICLSAAGILFGLGLILFLVFGVMDQFAAITRLDADPTFPISLGFSLLDGDEEKVFDRDTDQDGGTQEKDTVTYPASDVKNLDFDLHACVLEILPAKGQEIELGIEENQSQIRYRLSDDTLTITGKYNSNVVWKLGKDGNAPVIRLYLPEGMSFDRVQMEIGIGEVSLAPLQAKEMILDVGAATCEMQGLTADTVTLSVGAGTVELETLETGVLLTDIGAGELTADEVMISDNAEISIGMGSTVITGTINGNLCVDCGMGSIEMELAGAEEDFNYDVSSGMGNVEIGNSSFTSTEKQINNGSIKNCEISNGMGSTEISFVD